MANGVESDQVHSGNPVKIRGCPATVTWSLVQQLTTASFSGKVGLGGETEPGYLGTLYRSRRSIGRCVDIINSGKYLFLGGARSGKSYLAEQAIASRHPEICYVATAPRAWALADPDFADRIANHQKRRGANWQSVELDDPEELYDLIENAAVPMLVDSVGGWLASDIDFAPDLARLEAAILSCPTSLSFVAEEAGLSVHAESQVARRYVDLLGQTNQAISKTVDRVFFVAAGRATELYPLAFLAEG